MPSARDWIWHIAPLAEGIATTSPRQRELDVTGIHEIDARGSGGVVAQLKGSNEVVFVDWNGVRPTGTEAAGTLGGIKYNLLVDRFGRLLVRDGIGRSEYRWAGSGVAVLPPVPSGRRGNVWSDFDSRLAMIDINCVSISVMDSKTLARRALQQIRLRPDGTQLSCVDDAYFLGDGGLVLAERLGNISDGLVLALHCYDIRGRPLKSIALPYVGGTIGFVQRTVVVRAKAQIQFIDLDAASSWDVDAQSVDCSIGEDEYAIVDRNAILYVAAIDTGLVRAFELARVPR